MSESVNLPALLIVDSDREACLTIESTLARRFGNDYQILTSTSPTDGLEALRGLAEQGTPVALVAADLGLPGTDGIEFLAQAHVLHRGARRALLVAMDRRGTRIPFDNLELLQRAIALDQIDFSILKGWVSAEEWLYPQVQEALTTWALANQPHHEVIKIVGESWAARSYELRDLLSRNTVPFGFYATDSTKGAQLIELHGVDVGRLPAAILHDGSVLQDVTLADIVSALGFHTPPSTTTYDLAIIGAGPAGLAASVYGASEGLAAIAIEAQAIGGQAGTSSLIRNYLGFPRGLSGGSLTARAWEQALLFGASFVLLERAVAIARRDDAYSISLAGGSEVLARTVIVAAGVEYRRLGIPALERLTGAGVFYGASSVEAPAMTGQDVFVVGGANSAAEAALHLAQYAAKVTLLIRGNSLTPGMSDYLVTQIQSTSNIEVLFQTQIVDATGDQRLKSLVLENRATHERQQVDTVAVFVLIGAEAHTDWLPEEVHRDPRGFISTGVDIPSESWPSTRAPLSYESSLPGVFAVGDVRHGSMKRVAGAVGEGSGAVMSVHQYLAAAAVQAKQQT